MMNTASLHNPSLQYTNSPTDAIDRHDFGVQKNKKPASTGGGRAWSEDEEVYLLQTRLQKMPYKHIAAHLKKTELACRLHYHQLSHGSNRRKRTTSVSSGSSIPSPVMHNSRPSPIHESSDSDSNTPASYSHSYSPATAAQSQIQLPSAASLLSGSASPPRNSSHPIPILPKPSPPRRSLSDSTTTPPLRLNCAVGNQAPITVNNIDKDRLRRIYETHRSSFWMTIAAEYGEGVNPMVLEEAWRRGSINAPPTPCISPDSHISSGGNSYHQREDKTNGAYQSTENKMPATSISALLGIDASPTSPKERELIKRLEERRESEGDVRMEMA